MELEAINSAARTIDQNNMVLIVLLCLTVVHLIHEVFKPPFWVPLVAGPLFLFSAIAGVAILKAQRIFIATDVAVNTVIGATAGMVVCFIVGAIALRAVRELTDSSNFGPYQRRSKPVARKPEAE